MGFYIQENESEKNNESSSDEEDRGEDSTEICKNAGDSSCLCCGLKSKATLLEALNTPEIIQGIESTVENKLNRRFSSQSTIDISLKDHESLNRHEIASTDDISYCRTPVSRKPSSVSKKSSRSSRYGSMIMILQIYSLNHQVTRLSKLKHLLIKLFPTHLGYDRTPPHPMEVHCHQGEYV